MVESAGGASLMRKTSCKFKESKKAQVHYGILVAIITIASTFNLLIKPAKAGCNHGRGEAAIYSNSDKGQVTYIGEVEVYECGNSSGSFGGYRKGGKSSGWSVCYTNCKDPVVKNKQMIRIENGPFVEGEIEQVLNTTCVKERDRDAKFCWKKN